MRRHGMVKAVGEEIWAFRQSRESVRQNWRISFATPCSHGDVCAIAGQGAHRPWASQKKSRSPASYAVRERFRRCDQSELARKYASCMSRSLRTQGGGAAC